MIFSKSSPPDKLEYMRDIRLSPETLKKKEGKERSLKLSAFFSVSKEGSRKRKNRMRSRNADAAERKRERTIIIPTILLHEITSSECEGGKERDRVLIYK